MNRTAHRTHPTAATEPFSLLAPAPTGPVATRAPSRRRLSIFLLPLLVALGLSPAFASAAVTHHYLCQITGGGAGALTPSECDTNPNPAENPPLPGGLLSSVDAMTVDSGHLFVAEHLEGTLNFRTDRFAASTGAFEAQLPAAALTSASQGVAVGHSTGEEQIYLGVGNGAGTVAVFDSSGDLLATWSGTDTPAGSFASPINVAAAATGDVYVADWPQGVVDVFRPEPGGGEEYLTQLTGTGPGAPFTHPARVAVDSSDGDLFVVDEREEGGVVDIFEPTGPGEYAFLRQLTGTPGGPFESIETIAVDDSDGDLYVRRGAGGSPVESIVQFDSAGHYLGRLTGTPDGSFSANGARGMAVDPTTHDLYVGLRQINHSGGAGHEGVVAVFGPDIVLPDVETGSVSQLKPTSATLPGTVDPDAEGEATCGFLWGTSAEFGQTAACGATIPDGDGPVPVEAKLTGLQPDTTYFYRLQASNHNGTNPGEEFQTQHFTTPGPGLRGESVLAVTATSATLEATIDPDGSPTTYHFEYDTLPYQDGEPSHGVSVPVPGQAIGSGEGDLEVSQHLQGLVPSTVYHYRVVAESHCNEAEPLEVCEAEGPDHTFTTQTPAPFSLLDHRAWELVSPPDKHGALLQPIFGQGAIQAAASGDGLTYPSRGATEVATPGTSNLSQVLSTRVGGKWSSHDISIPRLTAAGFSLHGQENRFFSPDLSEAVVQPLGPFEPTLSPEATEQTPYLRTEFAPADPADPCQTSCFRPLLSTADVPEGAPFGEEQRCALGEEFCGAKFLGATPDLSHLILRSGVGLTSYPGDKGGLYEWSEGHVSLVSVLPDGQPAALQDGRPASSYTLLLGDQYRFGGSATHAISADGSRVIWTEGQAPNGEVSQSHLYLRDLSRGETVELDAVQGGSAAGTVSPLFQAASPDDSSIFFTDQQRLTPDSGGGQEKPDLYRCEIVEVAGHLSCDLTDLTPLTTGEPADVVGSLLGASEDASYLYFAADGVLAANAVDNGAGPETARPGDCAALVAGAAAGESCNLYRSHDGNITFLGTLGGADFADWGEDLHVHTSRVSPDGRWLAFMSQRSLTGYDNRDAANGVPDQEVFLYDADQGRLVCASCNPTGARPHGVEYRRLNTNQGGLVGGDGVWQQSQWIAANVPGWSPMWEGEAIYQSRYLSDSGRLFFDAADALVPQDSNGTEDVYEYEPTQGGEEEPADDTCTGQSPTYSSASRGCVDLISAGNSPEESAFLDASENGDDVFFLTHSRLSARDTDTALDIYDAHVGGGEAQPISPVECVGDGCQQPAVPPGDTTPGSLTFNGLGNVLECPKGKQLKQGKCVKQKAKKRHHKKSRHKRANANRRASR